MISNDTMNAEARDLVRASDAAGTPLRLLGGLAVRARCPSFLGHPFARDCGDMDLAALGPPRKLEDFFASRGYRPDTEFNMYNGGDRLLFRAPSGTKVDVFVSSFSMCHTLPLKGRLTRDAETIPLAELLLSKLQVVEANAKDLSDAACLLTDHALAETDGDCINVHRIGELCGGDWGLHRTLSLSLAKLRAWVESGGMEKDDPRRTTVLDRAAGLERQVDDAPKSPRWRARALVGDRMRWYEIVEEADR